MSATECFEISLNSLSDRLDVTYYLIRREVEQELDIGSPLYQLCTPVKTRTPPREAYNETGVPCLKLRNVTGQTLNITNCDCIPEHLKPYFVEAQKYDILLTATGEGTAGRVDIFLESDSYVVTGESIILRPKLDRINPFYLLAMLRTAIISKQLTHFVRGATGQTHLYWRDIADIKVPEATEDMQREFETIFRRAWENRNSVAQAIREAKTIVCKAGNLQGLDLRHKKVVFETTFKRIEPGLRFDVEYNQPIYEAVESKFAGASCVKANAVARLNKAMVNPRNSPTNVYDYVDISSVDTQTGDYDFVSLYGYEAPTRARRKPKKGDIIVSTVRPNRNAVAVIGEDSNRLVVSTGFAVLTPTKMSPLVLFAVLKTEPVYAQIVRKATAAMYPAVSEDDVLDIPIPNLSESDSNKIEQHIKDSIQLRAESESLLQRFRKLAEDIILQQKADSATNELGSRLDRAFVEPAK